MKKIISFSLWGDNPKYTIGAIKNAELAKTLYPDWVCRYYIGKSTPIEIINQLKSFDNTEVIEMEEEGNWLGMFWRFYAASDETVDIMVSRDCDSRLNLREKLAVNEWLESSCSFHIMRDHPYHQTEILGGMWGVKNPKLKEMKNLIDKFEKKNELWTDQIFLRHDIFPLIKNDCMVHDEFFQHIKFPSIREGKQFVGEAFDENDNPNIEHRSLI